MSFPGGGLGLSQVDNKDICMRSKPPFRRRLPQKSEVYYKPVKHL